MDTVKASVSQNVASNTQEKIQRFGRFLSGMVMPNIGAFIAWGLITALFIPTGWLPNESLSKLVGPMITYLLPVLIGFTGGKAVAGSRGGVLGAIATMGVIVGASIPMFMGAMIMGPLGGWVIKKFDEMVEGSVPAGFEMLVNNFSAGIIGGLLAILAYMGIGPVVLALNDMLKAGVGAIVNAGLLPLVSLFIEPGKILFLNNAMNHGILGPIGIQEAKDMGKSIFFLLETNPGPGLGILLAYWVFSKGMIKQSAPGAVIIHFLGGIHEIYFPYVLMNPILILAVIAGGMSGVFTFGLLGAGLIATPSPGSIFALLAMAPKGGYFAMLAGVTVATCVSFVVAAPFVKRANDKLDGEELADAQDKMRELKSVSNTPVRQDIRKIVFACDAGMGSSAMGASMLRNKLKKAGLDIAVVHTAIENIPADAEIIVTHEKLTDRARNVSPHAEHFSVKDFIDNDVFDIITTRISPKVNQKECLAEAENSNQILQKSNIQLGLPGMDYDEAIRLAGRMLYESGYVTEQYIDAMIERERVLSTYIGKGVAIPHGVGRAKEQIIKSGMVVLQFPEGISAGGEPVYMMIGIAGVGNEHLSILANIATVLENENTDITEVLKSTTNPDEIHRIFTADRDELA